MVFYLLVEFSSGISSNWQRRFDLQDPGFIIDYDNYYMLTDEINEFLEIYLDNVKGVDLDMKSLTEEFNLFTVYIVFRKFWFENC